MNLFSVARGLLFFHRNFTRARSLPEIPAGALEPGLSVIGCSPQWVFQAAWLYEQLNPGERLGRSKSWVLRALGKKLCAIVVDGKSQRVVGMSMYYFGERDIREQTVHEGFTGLVPDLRGRGLGTKLRLHALRHFARSHHLKGVSSRVSLDNSASLVSNLKLGFQEQERYFDHDLGVERVYLVCNLDRFRDQ